MQLDDESQKALKAYLIVELESICEADPGMLADYIIALLKHDKPMSELQPLMISQLEDFLSEATSPFVDTLFKALESKSYINSAKEEEIPIPTEPAADRRESQQQQQRDGRSNAPKHHRGDSDHSDDEDRSFKHARRHGNDDQDRDDHRRRREYSPSRPSGDDRFGNSRRNNPSQLSSSSTGHHGGMRSNEVGGNNDFDRRQPRQPFQQQQQQQQQGGRSGFNHMNNNDGRQQWNNVGNGDAQHPSGSGRNHFNDRGQWGGRGGRGGHMGGPDQGQDRPKRQRCRDYDEKGYCMRGDMCPYDHGDDRIVVDDMQRAAFEMMPGGPMAPFAMGPNGAPFFPGGPSGGNMPLPEGYDMNMPGQGNNEALNINARLGTDNFGHGGTENRMGQDGQPSSRGGMRGRGSMRGGLRGGRGRGGSHPYNSPGRFGSGSGGASTKTSLVVEHIPDEYNTISKVNEFFAQFGSLVNIQVDQPAHKALIQYSTREEASAAYNSPEVIFGNRFVKVYWQPDDQQGFGGAAPKPTGQVQPTRPDHHSQAPHHGAGHHHGSGAHQGPSAHHGPGALHGGPKPPAASVLMTPERAAELAAERAAAAAKAEENKKMMMEIQKQKEALIQRQQEEQNKMLQKLIANKTMSQEDKDMILKGLKNVAIEITKEVPNPLAHAQAHAAAAEAQRLAELEKGRLDRELEILGQTPSASGQGAAAALTSTTATSSTTTTGASENTAETTAALKAKLAALQAQASALGLSEGGGYAGRGRGGAFVPRGRGRGAMNTWTRGGARGGAMMASPHRTFRLDNRSSKISVQNVDSAAKAGLQAHFETYGELESFSLGADGTSAIVQYKNRKDAETAVQQGSQMANAAPLKLGWVTETAAPNIQLPASTMTTTTTFRSTTAATGSVPSQTSSSAGDVGASAVGAGTDFDRAESEDEDGERSWKR
ncbi:hypothetical protein BGZ94_006407 [Podila epigama]|nr:hypothetical protein BGZ94_006407 [Podila epigama]